MPSYKELKSSVHLEESIRFVENLLGIHLTASGSNKFSAYCPFHNDTSDSFRVYVNQKDEVRFHCWGACDSDWDVFDLIRKRKDCSFREAQLAFADYLQVDVELYSKHSSPPRKIEEPVEEEIPEDEPINYCEPKRLEPGIVDALNASAAVYHNLLLDNQKIVSYLNSRGVDDEAIQRYEIGYAPNFNDEDFTGKALLYQGLECFNDDYLEFARFNRAGLFRHIDNKDTRAAKYYYRRFVDSSDHIGGFGAYGDYFAGKITFPVKDVRGQACGMMGRRPDNRGTKWIKQSAKDLNPRGWLYGIDKACRYIYRYQTVILVEGIFDYFAVLRLFQDPTKPIVISTLGTSLTYESLGLLKQLNVKHFVVAYDWDNAGRSAIQRIAGDVDGTIYYLGDMKDGEDPAERLKRANLQLLDGFSLAHLLAGAEKAQSLTDKPVHIDFITTGKRGDREVEFSPVAALEQAAQSLPPKQPKDYLYDAEDFLPLLTYDHGNKALLEGKLNALEQLLLERSNYTDVERYFSLPANFVEEEKIARLGNALILWLKLVLVQQYKKRKVKITDGALAKELRTSRATVSKYKGQLKELGYLNVDATGKVQKLSVKYFVE